VLAAILIVGLVGAARGAGRVSVDDHILAGDEPATRSEST
jgi:hypothetical protein